MSTQKNTLINFIELFHLAVLKKNESALAYPRPLLALSVHSQTYVSSVLAKSKVFPNIGRRPSHNGSSRQVQQNVSGREGGIKKETNTSMPCGNFRDSLLIELIYQ